MKYKLLGLCSFFILMLIGTQLYSLKISNQLEVRLNEVNEIQLPAVRKISLIDMFHDSLQGLIYKSLYAAEKNDPDFTKEVADDLKESVGHMQQLIQELDQLNLKTQTKAAITETIPAIKKYIELAQSTSELASTNKRTLALANLDEFSKSFSALEEKLEVLGELIIQDSENARKESAVLTKEAESISLILLAISIIIGAVSTVLVVTKLMHGITKTVEEISQSIHELQNSSQKMSLVSQRLSNSVDTQVSSITGSVSAMDQIAAMIKNNDHSASTAATKSDQTKSSAESGQETVNRMMNEIKEISASYDEIQTNITKNGEEIRKVIDVISQIENKTKVINDIVFQTKLLSFNASVEAARAGESGKGFAVVAEEVGSLAEMSGRASTEISQMLSDSQNQVKNIAESTTVRITKIVEQGRVKVQNGTLVAENCLNELNQIITCVNDLDLSIREITTALGEQSKGVEEVNSALKKLDATTAESTEMSNRSKEASDDLNHQSHKLRVAIQDLRKVLGSKKAYDAPTYQDFVKEPELATQ